MLITETDYEDFDEKLEEIGLVKDEVGDWDAMTYGEFLREYCADETTTPNGIAPRMFIHDASKDDADPPEYEIREWKADGSTRIVADWELENKSYSQVETYLLHLWEHNKDRANAMWFTPEEAAEELGRDCAMIAREEAADEQTPPQVVTEGDMEFFEEVLFKWRSACEAEGKPSQYFGLEQKFENGYIEEIKSK
jgi:hypothetical protein